MDDRATILVIALCFLIVLGAALMIRATLGRRKLGRPDIGGELRAITFADLELARVLMNAGDFTAAQSCIDRAEKSGAAWPSIIAWHRAELERCRERGASCFTPQVRRDGE